MKSSSDLVDLIQELNLRFDDVEKLLQLLLINNLVEDAESLIWRSESNINSDVSNMILEYGLEFEGFKSINGIESLIIGIPYKTKITIKDLKQIYSEIKYIYSEIEPVFMYSTINGMQRKRILQESISFGVKGRELHVTNWRKKK